MDQEKTHINLVVIGHVDSGKSTTCGRLLYEMGSIDARELEKLQKEAEEREMGSFVFAYVMDQTKAERDRGITIDISLMQFQTPQNHYTIIDAPGHRDFIQNMITGTAQADVAMLVIAAPTGEFEAGISSEGQTREHALLAYTLGVKQLIVAVNQMDEQTVNFSQERFENIKSEMTMFLKKTGFDPSKVSFIPTSGFNGYNIMERCDQMEWYKGQTLLEILDGIVPPQRPTDKPLRIPVQGGYKIQGVGTVVTGRVETGILKVGKSVKFSNSGFTGEVRSIGRHHEILTEAVPGDNIGFNISGIAVKDVIKGSVVGDDQNSPPRVCESFIAQVIILNHPGEIRNGYTPVINCHAVQVGATFTKILSKVDRRTGAVIEEEPSGLKTGDAALVLMTPIKPICLENFNEFPSLGRFAARDMKLTVAVGVVQEINFSK